MRIVLLKALLIAILVAVLVPVVLFFWAELD